MELELVCSPCSPTTGSVSTVTSAVIDDKDTEWRTTFGFVNRGLLLRSEKDCYLCGKKRYKGDPDMIRAHLLPEIQPRSVGKACEPKPEHQQTYKDVCAILRKRLQDAKRKVDNQIKASKNTTDISSVFNTKPSILTKQICESRYAKADMRKQICESSSGHR